MEPLLELARARPPHWADDTIQPWDDDRFQTLKPFAISCYWNDSATLNVFQVKGTDHPDYQGQTWNWFIQHGKRMNLNLPLQESNRKYYMEAEKKKEPPMFYISINGHDWYVYGDGNHRTCIARFDFHFNGLTELHGLTITDWRFDYVFSRAYERLAEIIAERRLPYTLTCERKTLVREDNPGWQREKYKPLIRVRGKDFGQDGHAMDRFMVMQMIKYLESPWYRRLFAAIPDAH